MKSGAGTPVVHTGEGSGDERLIRGYSGQLLIGLSTGYLAIQLGRNIFSPLLPAIVEDLAISSFEAGVAISVLSAGYALCMYPGGRLSDRLTRKTVLVAAALVTAVGFGVLAVAGSYPALLASAATVGLGAGLYWIALRGLLADLFVDRRGQAFGIQDALGFVGPIVAAGGAVAVLTIGGWRLAFPPLVVFLLAAAAFAHLRIDEPYELARVELGLVATGWRVFGDRQVRWLVVGYTCGIFAMQAVIGFLPLFLQAERGLPSAYASAGFAVLFLGAVITMPAAGYLGDRLSHTPVAVGGLCLSIAGLLGFVLGPSRPIIALGILSFGLGIWAFPPVIQAHLMSRFPDESMGGDFGAFKTVYAGVGSLGPTYVGFAAGVVGYTPAFLGLTALLVTAIVVFLWV